MITAFLLDFLTTIPQSICGTAVVLYIFYILLGEKPAWKNIVLYTAVSLVLSFPLYILLTLFILLSGFSYLMFNLMNIILHSLLILIVKWHEEHKKIIWYSELAYFIMTLPNMCVGGIINEVLSDFGITSSYTDIKGLIICSILQAVVCGGEICLVFALDRKYSLHSIAEYIRPGFQSWGKIFLFFIIMLLVTSAGELIVRLEITTNTSTSLFMLIFCLVGLAGIHQTRIKMLQEKAHQTQAEMLEQQEMYIQELEGIQSSMRSFRHDYKNMMSSLYLQSREGNIEEVEKNIHGLIDEFDENIDRKMNLTVQMANIRISEVKSLLYKKITEIQKKGIDFQMEVMYPVEETSMKPIDLSRALGILIDNAIEAAEPVQGNISLVISAQEDGVHIILDNTADQDVDISKIYEDGYSTKGNGRGTGLPSLRKILEKYPEASLLTEIKSGRFIQKILIANT